jgi:integrase
MPYWQADPTGGLTGRGQKGNGEMTTKKTKAKAKPKSRATMAKIRALADPKRNPNPHERAVAVRKQADLTPKAKPTPRGENRLTARTVATVGDGWHGDGNHLYLRVDGVRRRWIVKVVRGGVKREFGVGSVETTNLAFARQKRDRLLEQLKDGLDPVEEKQKAREADREARAARARRKTFADAADAAFKKQSAGWRTSSEGRTSSMDDWAKSLAVDCKSLRSKAVEDIGMEDVKKCVQPFWDKGQVTTARRLLNRIELVIEYALAHDWRDENKGNPAAWKRFQHIAPATPKNGGKAHHAALDWRDMPAFMMKLREIDSTSARCLEFLILTATRSGEARGARWSEIDFAAKKWTIPEARMKAGEVHDVPLSRQALALLGKLGKTPKAKTGSLIFPSDRVAQPLDVTATWKLLQALAPGVTVHGMRATFKTWCSDHNIPREEAEASLAHQIGNAVERAYNRTDMLERRRPVMQQWADFIDGAATGKVIALKGRKRR